MTLEGAFYCVASIPSALPTVSFHSFAVSAPARLSQPFTTVSCTSFLKRCWSASATGTMIMLASFPFLHGCLPTLQFAASASRSFIVCQHLSSNFLYSASMNACTSGSSFFQLLRLTTWTLIAQPSEIGIRYFVTSVQPATLPTAVPVTAQSTTLFCSAVTTSRNAMLTGAAPMTCVKSTMVLV